MKYIIITRHKGAIEWLRSRGIEGKIIEHFNGYVEKDTTYIGILPIPMIHSIVEKGGRFILLSLPSIAFKDRGNELTPEEMDKAGAALYEIQNFKMVEVEV